MVSACRFRSCEQRSDTSARSIAVDAVLRLMKLGSLEFRTTSPIKLITSQRSGPSASVTSTPDLLEEQTEQWSQGTWVVVTRSEPTCGTRGVSQRIYQGQGRKIISWDGSYDAAGRTS
ncbi:hypothetical protein MRX96_029368 [Rhipicephalus microplus]